MDERIGRLSRFLALILRHQGPQMGLTFDNRGFTQIEPLVKVVRQSELFEWVERSEIEAVVQSDLKGRYEIEGDLVRARYGHSAAIPVAYPEVEPPKKLYYAPTGQSLRELQKTGIRPEGRRLVHLSIDESTAFQVGRHKTSFPVVLEIDAEAAHKAGVKFHQPTKHIFVTEGIPPEFIRVIEPRRPAAAPPPRPPGPPPPRFGRMRR
jgi:putative RNA 2'-phosphotransferase